jgi:hypothetical protein
MNECGSHGSDQPVSEKRPVLAGVVVDGRIMLSNRIN